MTSPWPTLIDRGIRGVPLTVLDPIFKGVTSVNARKAFGRFVQKHKQGFEEYHVPCAGQFTIPEALIDVGVSPNLIHASDITLFSSALGYLADPSKQVEDLGFKVLDPHLAGIIPGKAKTDVEKVAQIMLAIKYAQLTGDREYIKWQRREFAAQAQSLYAGFCEVLESFVKKCGGLHYEIADVRDVAEQAKAGQGNLLWFNPPGYSGGYGKMFDPKGLYEWAAPAIKELTPKDAATMLVELRKTPATIAAYFTEGHAIKELPEGWLSYFAELNKKGKLTHIALNKKGEDLKFTRKAFMKVPEKRLPVFDDHEITKNSKIAMVPCTKEMALYYYDLFVRELGMVEAVNYYLFTIDGQVAGACGFDPRFWIIKRMSHIYETFGLSITSERYARIGRLLMMSITCRQFMDEFLSGVNPSLLFTPPKEIQTACLTKYPEAKKNRGILKLTSRTQLPNGRYHLIYKTNIWERNYQQCLDEWLVKHASYTRATGGGE